MAFTIRNLSVLAYANGFTLWHYKTGDERALVEMPGYFADAADMLAVGDMMMLADGTGPRVVAVASQGDQVLTSSLT
ncbi:MAG: hypothetical protein JOZ58_12660 [Acetobacteraceae bacterium]|jgi:hypothetical protein|nr:hypothetical protein [Acetobacteraceae bacterium]MBV8575871.1 hypothetical protein [Acetobacteraceae bacterium]